MKLINPSILISPEVLVKFDERVPECQPNFEDQLGVSNALHETIEHISHLVHSRKLAKGTNRKFIFQPLRFSGAVAAVSFREDNSAGDLFGDG